MDFGWLENVEGVCETTKLGVVYCYNFYNNGTLVNKEQTKKNTKKVTF